MALVLNDRVKETTTTTGTGTVNLAGAETGFESFVAGIGNSNTCYYAIVHQTADEFEVGLGTVTDATPDTLARTTVISSSNSDSAVNFSAGTKDVFCTLPASKTVFEDASDNIALGAAPTVSNASGDLTLDVVGSINLDADNNAEVSFKDAGTEIGKIFSSSSDFALEAGVQDKDIIFRGNDGGGGITALTLDMSDAGSAYFNNMVGIGTTTPDTDGYSYAEDLVIKAGASASDGAGLSINSVGRQYGVIAFGDSGATNSGEIFYDHTGNALYFKTSAVSRWSLDSSGNMIATGNVTAYGSVSDERLKENIEVIENPIEKIKDLKGVTFTYKKDGQKSTGLIAQDLEKVLPEAVYTSKTIADEREGEVSEEHLAIRYGNTVGLLVEAIKELEARVKELEDR